MKLWRMGRKLSRATLHAVQGFWTIHTVFPRLEQAEQQARVQVWARQMLAIVEIELQVDGTPPHSGPVLLVANHVSWLDIVVMHASRHCRFVSKADVQGWPFIRTLAHGAGTLYLERGSRRDAHRVVRQMADRLTAGDILAVFPEGTTGDGVHLKPFHSNMFQSAIDANVPVQALALKYLDVATGDVSFAPRYVDDDTLRQSLWRTLTAPPLKAVVRFGSPQAQQGQSRRDWATQLRSDIEALRAE